jgi:hypothetical protein
MMIKNTESLRRYEENWISKQKLTYEQALNIIESMWEEGTCLGVLPPKDPMEGIDVDVRVARILNSCSKSY